MNSDDDFSIDAELSTLEGHAAHGLAAQNHAHKFHYSEIQGPYAYKQVQSHQEMEESKKPASGSG